MTSIVVCPIVEGHGEYEAARPLIQRVWTEIVGGQHAEVLRPIRGSRGKLLIEEELRKALELASAKLQQHPLPDAPRLVLLLIGGEGDPCCVLGPRLLSIAQRCAHPGIRPCQRLQSATGSARPGSRRGFDHPSTARRSINRP